MPTYLLTCAAGFEELCRGDLQQAGLPARPSGAGTIAIEDGLGLVEVVGRQPMVDRVAVSGIEHDALSAAERLCRAAGFADEIAFRVGSGDSATRADVVRRVASQTGWRNDPSAWALNVDVDRGRVEVGPLAWAQRFGRLARLPATTPPVVAAGVLRLVKLGAGDLLLDPCAGVGTLPIVAAVTHAQGRALAVDADPEAVTTAAANVAALGLGERVEVRRGDARRLDRPDGSVPRVATDLPFGKKVGSTADNRQLYPAVLRELARVLTPDGRAVLLTDDKRTFTDAVRRTPELKVVKETLTAYNGVRPSAYVVTRVRARGRPGPRRTGPR